MLIGNIKEFLSPHTEPAFLYGIYCLSRRLPIDRSVITSIMEYTLFDRRIHTIPYALSRGYLYMVKHLYENGYVPPEFSFDNYVTCDSIEQACREGHVECLKYVVRMLGRVYIREMCSSACAYGLVEVLKEMFDYYVFGKENIADMLSLAVTHGYLPVIEFLNDRGYLRTFSSRDLYKSGYSVAISYRCVQAIQYFHRDVLPACDDTMRKVVTYDMFDVAVYLCENGVSFPRETLVNASRNGSYKLVKYIHAHMPNDLEMMNSALIASAHNGHYEIAEYLSDNGADLNVLLKSNVVQVALKLLSR